jgi:hypothetical protein
MFGEEVELNMKMNKILAVPLVCAGLSMPAVTWAAGDFPAAGVDKVPSLAKFQIVFTQEFAYYLKDEFNLDFCKNTTKPEKCPRKDRTYESPVLSDEDTKVGRSSMHLDGGDTDEIVGAEVCKVGTKDNCDEYFPPVTDSDIHTVPPSEFKEGPKDTEEVHTRVISLSLEGDGGMIPGKVKLKAGDEQTSCQPPSHGEVESIDDDGKGFPAESIFYMRVEVEFDADNDSNPELTLFNTLPLTLEAEIEKFPPHVIYVHTGGEKKQAVPIFIWNGEVDDDGHCKTSETSKKRIGLLKVAAHGMNFDSSDPEIKKKFNTSYETDIKPKYTLSVKLDAFTATAGNGEVALEWATGTEKNNAGFVVWRGQPLDGKCSNDPKNYTDDVQAITPLVASQGTEVSGATYTMTDSNVVSGNTYCYALEDIDYNGKSTFHMNDIVSATP